MSDGVSIENGVGLLFVRNNQELVLNMPCAFLYLGRGSEQ